MSCPEDKNKAEKNKEKSEILNQIIKTSDFCAEGCFFLYFGTNRIKNFVEKISYEGTFSLFLKAHIVFLYSPPASRAT